MRSLKTGEKRLGLIFIGLIFLLLNLFLLQQGVEKCGLLDSELRQLRLEKAEAEYWLSQKEIWQTRNAWMNEKLPKKKGSGQESAEFLETLQLSARQQKITIAEQTIADPSTNPYYFEVAVHLQVKGTLDAVLHWLASLQNPESFLAITSLTLKKEPEGSAIICQLTAAKWYALP